MIIPTGANDTRMTTNKRQTLVDFLSYALCEGQGKAGAYGYSPLPLNLVQAGFDQVAKLGAADPGVNIVGRDATTCDNPTFLAGDPSRNYLAEIAPQPASCDALGAGPCGSPISPPGDLALALKVPSDGLGGLVLHGPRSLALVAARDVSSVHATADLSALSVEDTRDDGSLGTWQVNVQATAFTGSPGVVDARYLGWRPALPALVPGNGSLLAVEAGPAVESAYADSSSEGLGSSRLLARALVPGRGTTTLTAALDLVAPSTTPAGSYTSTLTVTLVSS